MSADDVLSELLDRRRPALVGVVSTLRSDCSPHAVPVWYRWDGDVVRIWTDAERVWVRNIARDSRVAFTVHESEWPFGAVLMRGRAAVRREEDERLRAEARRISARYVDAAEVDAYVERELAAARREHERWSGLRAIVTITPDWVRAWARGA